MKKSLLTILCTLLSVFSWAQGSTTGDESGYEAYAALSENNTVLTFFYDENKANRNGMSVGPFSQASERGWDSNKTDITNVVFDDSFVNATNITSTAYWFADCSSLTEIRGIGNLNTSNVTTMLWMFCGCTSLSSIDLSGFNTVNVTDMSYMFMRTGFTSLDLSSFSTYKVTQTDNMFRGCFGLTTIYVGSDWNMGAVTSGADMFLNCSNLVGGAGTTYNANRIDYTYAHIDGGENNPGYFTEKNTSYNEAYAVLVSEDGGNIMYATLYYDGNKANHTEGFAVVGLDEMLQNQAWMMNRSNIKTVNFDESFANCNPTSTAYWFAFCNSLTAINGLQYLNTEFVTNMEYMFHMCPALSSIDLSHFRAKSLTNMNAMFGGCSSLTSLDLSGFFTFTVTNMNYLFSGCTNLKTIYVNKYDWSTESVTAGDGVFENCTSLVGGAGTTFNDSHIDYTYARIDGGPNSQTPGYFTDIDASASVVAPEFRFEGDNLAMTTETQNASIFYKVAELPSMAEAVVDSVRNSLIVTPDGQQSTYYEHPFELKMAAVVKAIAVADNATGTIVSDTTTMVYDYEAWVNLKAAVSSGSDLYGRAQGNPNVDAQLLEDLQWALNEGDMIYNQRAQMDSFEAIHFTQRINELCAQIEAQMSAEDEPYAVLSDNNTVLTFYYDKQKSARGGMSVGPFSYYDDTPWFSTRNTITTVEIDSSFVNCTSLTSTAYWFADLQYLTTITGIGYLKTDNVKSMAGMFLRCHSLPSIDVSGFNTANVTTMEAMFYECQSLTTLDVSALNTSKVTTMEMMFQSCTNLTTLDVSTFNTSSLTNMLQMFCKCSGLTTLTLGNFNTDKVTAMSGLFNGCSSLTNIDVSSINTSMVDSFFLMFDGCSSLTTLDLSNFNSAHVYNMIQMFYGCTNLTSIYVGSGWTTSEVTSSENMFLSCTNLRGGAGTTYDENHVDVSYAHIDGGEGNPGYFTDKNPVEASYYDHVLYVGGSVTLAEAMQKFGTNKVVETIAAIVWNSSQAISTSELQVITNPNLLIYVQDASLAPANRDNVVINGFAKNVVLSDVTSGNNNFYCPEDFMAEAISYTRNFQQQTEVGISRGWESIALPFDVQTIMHEKNGALAPFGSSEGGKPFWLRQMSDNGLVQAIEIHANRPYLISMPNSTEYPAEFNQPGRVTFSSLNVRVPVTEEEAVAMADSTIVLIPTFQRMEQSDWIYALNVGETRAQYPEGSVFEQGLRAVRPFEAFTVHNNNQSNPAPRYIAINEIGNGTLGIDATLVNREEVNSEEWYSLDGRKLQGKPAQKGIYIQNGKKVIIK